MLLLPQGRCANHSTINKTTRLQILGWPESRFRSIHYIVTVYNVPIHAGVVLSLASWFFGLRLAATFNPSRKAVSTAFWA
jgi:hypothetical protein